MNFKYTILFGALIALTGTSCRGAAYQELSELERSRRLNKLLLDNGNDPQKALFSAVKNNLVWAIDDLSDRGINLEAWDRNHQTPLERAALQGYEAMVAKLLAKGARVSEVVFLRAIDGNRVAVIKQLIEAGAPVSAISSAIGAAQRGGKLEIAEILLKAERAAQEQQARSAEAESAAFAAEIERSVIEARRSRAAEIAAGTIAEEERASAMAERIVQNREESTPPRYSEQATHDTVVPNMAETVCIPRYTKYKVGDPVRVVVNGTPKIGVITDINVVEGSGDQYKVSFDFREDEINPS